jgi:N-carbamoylputrescine amidase
VAPPIDSRRHWQRVQQGHAAANLLPLIAANRIGTERSQHDPERLQIRFYGSSFIADQTGALLAEAGDAEEAVLLARFDLREMRRRRDGWFLFRDRRPELYGPITTLDGGH